MFLTYEKYKDGIIYNLVCCINYRYYEFFIYVKYNKVVCMTKELCTVRGYKYVYVLNDTLSSDMIYDLRTICTNLYKILISS